MELVGTGIPGVLIVEPVVHGDERGFFMETWNKRTWLEHGLDVDFVQDNHSRSRKNILRGLHYQVGRPQGKLVRVILGEVFDVAVDLRRSSPHFGKWVGVTLSAANRRMLWIPPGFAHGFYVQTDEAEFVYKCTDFYAPEYERCIVWNDPDVGIVWPETCTQPVLSNKDCNGSRLADAQAHG